MDNPYAAPKTAAGGSSPAADPKPRSPRSVIWGMISCVFWLLFAQHHLTVVVGLGLIDWVAIALTLTALACLLSAIIAPRSKFRHVSLICLFALFIVRIGESFVSIFKTGIGNYHLGYLLMAVALLALFIYGLQRVSFGEPARRFFAASAHKAQD